MFSFISFDPFQKRTQTYLNESHYIPLFCPSALTFLTPPRGIGWDCTAMECSPLAQGSKCLGAQGKESKNKITGFVTPQIYWEANSLYLCAHKVARIRRPSRRKATEVAIRRKSPKALPQRNGELLPLVTLFFDHTWLWNESPRLSKPLAHFFSLSLLIRSRHQHQLKETREHSRAEAQYINWLFFHSTVVEWGCNVLIQRLLDNSMLIICLLEDKPPIVWTSTN